MDHALERRIRTRRRRMRNEHTLRTVRYLLAAAAILLAVNIFFEISDIQVEGNVIYSSTEITEASGLRTGVSGLLPLRAIASRRIRSSLPGVSSARISRSKQLSLFQYRTDIAGYSPGPERASFINLFFTLHHGISHISG